MDASTWDRQPWWAQEIYQEGLVAEQPWKPRTLQIEKEFDPFVPWRGVFADQEEKDALASVDDLSGLGVKVRRKKAPAPQGGTIPEAEKGNSEGA